jgi:hypothetical protein
LEKWVKENENKIMEYNKFDVLALYSLTKEYRETVMSLCMDEDADVFKHLTIGSQSYKLMKNSWK